MSMIETVVRRPVTILIIFALVLIVGFVTLSRLPVDLFPDITRPVITVSTTFSDASPQEIETSITEPLERVLANVSRVEEMRATISSGLSRINLEFSYGTDLDAATNDVRDRIELVRQILPSDSVTQIFQFDTSSIPTIVLQISGDRDLSEIYTIADEQVRPLLERLDGVAQAAVAGGDEPIISIDVPLNRLAAYDLSLADMARLLAQNNAQVAGGGLTINNTDYQVETAGKFVELSEIRDAVIAYRNDSQGNPYVLQVNDIGDVQFDSQRTESEVYINGSPGLYIAVLKRSNANTVQVSDLVQAAFPEIQQNLPPSLNVGIVWDGAETVRQSLSNVATNALWGAMLAVLVLFIFLRSLRSTLVIVVSIPISIVITLLAMYAFDLTINIMTLAGLALGVGLLVDNSIVILENIYRFRERGAKLTSSAVLGTREMVIPIFASTLTTVVVFAPLLLFRSELEFIGELFSALVFTVVISLLTSLIVAILLVPVLSSKYFRIKTTRQHMKKGFTGWMDSRMETAYVRVEVLYKRFIAFLLRHRGFTILGLVVLFTVVIWLVPVPGFSVFPRFGEGQIEVNIELPAGTQKDVTKNILFELDAFIREEVLGIDQTIVDIGEQIRGAGTGTFRGNIGTLTVNLPPYEERTHSPDEVTSLLRSQFKNYPSASFQAQRNDAFGNAEPVEIFVKGQNMEQVRSIASDIVTIMEGQELASEAGPGERPVYIGARVDETEPIPQLSVRIDRQKAYHLGLDVQSIGQEINAALDGITAGVFESAERDYDIVLGLKEKNDDTLTGLDQLTVYAPNGQKVTLDNIAYFETVAAPETIRRINQSRYVTIVSQLPPDLSISEEIPKLQQLVRENIPAYPGIIIEYAGEYQELSEQTNIFFLFALLSILLVFGIMASLFESFLDPLIIFFTIPLTFVGVYGIYGLTGDTINAFSAVGLIMLIGIVVNNAIVLVDYTNLLRKRGMGVTEACAEAGRRRLRPILMTSLTTMLGMTPLAFRTGEGSELIQPIAKTVFGGLAASTLLTLIFIPVIYSIFNVFSEKIRSRIVKRRLAKELELEKIPDERAEI